MSASAIDEPQSPVATHFRPFANGGKTVANGSPNMHMLDLARAFFDKKVPAGRHRGGYTDAGVLLIYWQDDDLGCSDEVKSLEKVFRTRYGFETQIYEIPPERSTTALQVEISAWAHKYNGSDKLSIIYYGGHGYQVEGDQETLGLSGNRAPDPQQKRRAQTFFDMFLLLDKPDTDTLLIVDCCYAARSFSRGEVGKRKFELLSSVAPNTEAMGPRHSSSFTKTLCTTLETLYKETYIGGFSTSKLYRKLYHGQPLNHKPFLFDQSPKNYGRIWIRPLNKNQTNEVPKNSQIYLDMRLQLNQLPTEAKMADLAASMQYLPNVRSMKFEYLHAPDDQLQFFLDTVAKAQLVRPFIKKLYRRVQQKKLELNKNSADQSIEDNENLTTWNPMVLEWSGGTVESVQQAKGRISRQGTQTSEAFNGTEPQNGRVNVSSKLRRLHSVGSKMKKGVLHLIHPPVKVVVYVVSVQLQFVTWLHTNLARLEKQLKP